MESWSGKRGSNPRPSAWESNTRVRGDARLRLVYCEGMLGAAPGCTRGGSRLYPAPAAVACWAEPGQPVRLRKLQQSGLRRPASAGPPPCPTPPTANLRPYRLLANVL